MNSNLAKISTIKLVDYCHSQKIIDKKTGIPADF
jgi:hypothetical protein